MLRTIRATANYEYKELGQWVEADVMHAFDLCVDGMFNGEYVHSEEEIADYKQRANEKAIEVLKKHEKDKRFFGLSNWEGRIRLADVEFEEHNCLNWSPSMAAKNLSAEDYKQYLIETGLVELTPLDFAETVRH